MYYGAKKCEDEETKITLDVDVTTGEGPETITLHKLNPGRSARFLSFMSFGN